jgi:hypothetical protein
MIASVNYQEYFAMQSKNARVANIAHPTNRIEAKAFPAARSIAFNLRIFFSAVILFPFRFSYQ